MVWCFFFAAAFVRSGARLVKRQPSPDNVALPLTR
jgi:hypothetical protein